MDENARLKPPEPGGPDGDWESHRAIARNWLRRGVPPSDVARWLGIDPDDLAAIEHGPRPRGGDRWAPTPTEVRQRAAAIRSRWTDLERRQRLAGPAEGFDGPLIPQCFPDGNGWSAVG